MRRIDTILEVTQLFDIISQGATMPIRCSLENGMTAVVKYMRNPYGQRVLINELVGTCIADELGLIIPEFGICNISESVIESTNTNEEIDTTNSGYGFFSNSYSTAIPLVPYLLPDVQVKQTELLMLFDNIVNNCDRHDGNILLEVKSPPRLLFIDNSHILFHERTIDIQKELSPSSILSTKVMESNRDIYDNLCYRVGYSEETLISEATRIQSTLSETILGNIKHLIPDCWIQSTGQEYINNMFLVIQHRLAALTDICKIIIRERRR